MANSGDHGDAILGSLTEALNRLGPCRTPPPPLCGDTSQLVRFFDLFERYVLACYGNDKVIWLQVLPTYYKGEVRLIVDAFSPSVPYDDVKARMLADFTVERRITRDNYLNLLEAKRGTDENLKCFRIRLETLASKIEASQEGKDSLILSALRNNIPREVLQQVDLQLCSRQTLATVTDFVKLVEAVARACDGRAIASQRREVHRGLAMTPHIGDDVATTCDVRTVKTRDDGSAAGKCYRCNQVGHFAKNCPRRSISSEIVCFSCSEKGHTSRNCPMKSMRQGAVSSSVNLSCRRVICYCCNGEGHLAKNCPNSRPMARIATLQCGYCGKDGHAMARCPDFQAVLRKLDSINLGASTSKSSGN